MLGTEIDPIEIEIGCLALKKRKTKVSILHGQLGHAGEEKVHATAKMMKWYVTRKYCGCEVCGLGKAKQKPIPRERKNRAMEKGKLFLLKISSVKRESYRGSKFWIWLSMKQHT